MKNRTSPAPTGRFLTLTSGGSERGWVVMLSIGRLGPEGGGSYTSHVGSDAENYCLGCGEAPDRWAKVVRTELDLEAGAAVDSEAPSRLLDRHHPTSSDPLVTAEKARTQGLDLTFSTPKSVTSLWALHPDLQVRHTVAADHDPAVADAVGFLESGAIPVRINAATPQVHDSNSWR